MSASVKRLEETGNALRAAMVQRDWTAISVLDTQCRQVVEEAMNEAHVNESAIGQRLQELTGIYRELVIACEAEHRRVAGKAMPACGGAKVYQLFG